MKAYCVDARVAQHQFHEHVMPIEARKVERSRSGLIGQIDFCPIMQHQHFTSLEPVVEGAVVKGSPTIRIGFIWIVAVIEKSPENRVVLYSKVGEIL